MTQNKKGLRVGVYVRVSTDEQANDGKWLEAQLTDITNYISRHSAEWFVFDEKLVYREEGVSWFSDSRPELDRLVNDATSWRLDVVMVNRFDRLARSQEFLMYFIRIFETHGVRLVCTESDIDTTTDMGKLIAGLFGWLGQVERGLIRDRTMSWKLEAAKNGYYVLGRVPYGYRKWEDKKLHVVEEEAMVINRICDLLVNERKTQGQIATILTNENVPVKSDTMKGVNKPEHRKWIWRQTTISGILEKTHYLGYYYVNQRRYIKWPDGTVKMTPRPEKDWIRVECPQVVDEKLFRRAQEMVSFNKKNAKSKERHRYLLAGLIHCGKEDCLRCFQGVRWGKGFYSYKCKGKWGYVLKRNGEKCGNPDISASQAEGAVWNSILELIRKPANFKKYVVNKSEMDGKIRGYETQLATIAKNKEAVESDMRDILSLMQKTTIGMKIVEEKFLELENQLAEILKRGEELEALIQGERNKQSALSTIAEISRKFADQIGEIEKDREAMFHLINMLVYKVVVHEDRIEVYFVFDNDKPSVLPRKLHASNSASSLRNHDHWTKNRPQRGLYFVQKMNDWESHVPTAKLAKRA